jgi:hypothetical protein
MEDSRGAGPGFDASPRRFGLAGFFETTVEDVFHPDPAQ